MGIFQKIASLFSLPKTTTAVPVKEPGVLTQAQNDRWQALQGDQGEFIYESDGFRYPFKNRDQKFEWSAIERITGYKLDLATTDEICLDIFADDRKITFSESTPGWYQLIAILKATFPIIPDNWDGQVMLLAFATNFTVLYEREDRIMPESINFYALLKTTSPEMITTIFEQNAWKVRKSGWTEVELFNNWSELNLGPDGQGLLLNGLVAFHPANIAKLDQLLDSFGVAYQYEYYDSEKQLLLEKTSPG